MIEIRNTQKSPIQLMVRSRRAPKSFTTLHIPGLGKQKNVVYLEDERMTDYIYRVEEMGLITIRQVPNTKG